MKKIAIKYIIYSFTSAVLAETAFEGTSIINSGWNDVFAEIQNWKFYLLS